jgi:hypothetical protein
LIGDELVEIGVREHAALTALAAADGDVAEIARGDVRVEGLDGAAQFCRCFGRRAQPIRWARLAQLAWGNLSALADAEQLLDSFTQGSGGLRL